MRVLKTSYQNQSVVPVAKSTMGTRGEDLYIEVRWSAYREVSDPLMLVMLECLDKIFGVDGNLARFGS